jgi:hypothetical protein
MNPYPKQKGFGLRVARAKKAMIGLALGQDERTVRATGETYSFAHSRAIDNCFESGDGEAVVWQLMHLSAKEPDKFQQSLVTEGIKKFLGNESALRDWQAVYEGREP